jgi:hypothetical protein
MSIKERRSKKENENDEKPVEPFEFPARMEKLCSKKSKSAHGKDIEYITEPDIIAA